MISDGSSTLYIALGVVSDAFAVTEQETWFISMSSSTLSMNYFLRKKAGSATNANHYILDFYIGSSYIWQLSLYSASTTL